MQLQDLGVTENILKVTGAREVRILIQINNTHYHYCFLQKVASFITNSYFGPLARSILNEWEDQIKEFSPPSSPSTSSMGIHSQMDELFRKLLDSSQVHNHVAFAIHFKYSRSNPLWNPWDSLKYLATFSSRLKLERYVDHCSFLSLDNQITFRKSRMRFSLTN